MKCARASNFTTVHKHFEKLSAVFEDCGIPFRKIHNCDETGIQLGGGRRGDGTLYFYQVHGKAKYKISSEGLELVTVLETVCADGQADIMPCFVFSSVKHYDDWYPEDDTRPIQ